MPEIWPLGVGIKILPRAVRELMQQGLTEKQEKIGIQTRELVYANRYVQQIG